MQLNNCKYLCEVLINAYEQIYNEKHIYSFFGIPIITDQTQTSNGNS